MIFPFNRYIFIMALFSLLIIQQAVYYLEIRKYLAGVFPSYSEQSNEELKKLEQKKVRTQRRIIVVISVVTISILTLTGIRLFQMETIHQANMVKAESCLDQDGTVIFEQRNFWSLSTITCEKS